MKWAWFAVVALAGAGAIGVYACSSDTFSAADGGGDAGNAGDAGPQTTQAEFCDAEAAFFAHCHIDAGCIAKDLNDCGSLYAAMSPAFAHALATCIEQNQLSCTEDFVSQISSSCMQTQLFDSTNDGASFKKLTADYCAACGTDVSCKPSFAANVNQPGYFPSLFSDPIIDTVDTDCALQLDGGTVTAGDASVTCTQQFTLCALVVIGDKLPKDACSDGG